MSSHLHYFLSSFLLTPYHPLFFIHYHLLPLPHGITPLYPPLAFPLIPFHPLLFIHNHPFHLSHVVPSSLFPTIVPYYAMSCPPFCSLSPPHMQYYPSFFIVHCLSVLTPYHPLFFIRHHLSSLFCSISSLFPITISLTPYHSSVFIHIFPFIYLFHVIPSLSPSPSLSHAILSSLLPITPSLYLISSTPPFHSPSPFYIISSFSLPINPLPLCLFSILFSHLDHHSELPKF